MSSVFVRFKALPDDCNGFLARNVAEEQSDEMVKAYCEECERRHAFVPVDDD